MEFAGVQEEHVLVFYRHTTGCRLIITHKADFGDALDRISPPANDFTHHWRGPCRDF